MKQLPPQKQSYQLERRRLIKRQHGVTFLELLTVISIIGIMAYAGMPQFSNVMIERDLSTAKNTLIQTLYRAKNIARAESTIVNISIANNIITLDPYNSSPNRVMKMPKKIGVSSAVTFSFNATGLVSGNNGLTSIVIESSSNSALKETITISTTGMIAAL